MFFVQHKRMGFELGSMYCIWIRWSCNNGYSKDMSRNHVETKKTPSSFKCILLSIEPILQPLKLRFAMWCHFQRRWFFVEFNVIHFWKSSNHKVALQTLQINDYQRWWKGITKSNGYLSGKLLPFYVTI